MVGTRGLEPLTSTVSITAHRSGQRNILLPRVKTCSMRNVLHTRLWSFWRVPPKLLIEATVHSERVGQSRALIETKCPNLPQRISATLTLWR